MAKELRWEFTVVGNGPFPIDMLRYDHCWPKTESSDSSEITNSFYTGIKRRVSLVGLKEPTVDRWESFWWKVIESRKITLV